MTNTASLLSRLADAVREQRTLPPMPPALSETEGYQWARQLTAMMTLEPGHTGVGLKAGLTDPRIQAHFGLREAMLGHLYPDRRLESPARLRGRPRAQIECEMAIYVDRQGRPRSLGPVVEFVRVDFARSGDLTPANLAAINLGADAFLPGEPRPWEPETLAAMESTRICFYRNDVKVFEAPANHSLGGVREARAWMVDKARRLNWPLADDTLLITGTVGKPQPLEAGDYRVDYGRFGMVSFRVDPDE